MVKQDTTYVYIVKCMDDAGNTSFYTGITRDPERRLKEHKYGYGAQYFSSRQVLGMNIVTVCVDRGEAMREERRVKRLKQCDKWDLYNSGRPVEL